MNTTNKIRRPYQSMTTDTLKARRQELLGMMPDYYNGKTQLDSVPKSFQDKVSQCIKDYEDITALLAELSRINLELFRRRESDL